MNYQYASKRARGYTLMELLAVMLIFTILLVMALVLYNSAIADSHKKACRANMQAIANAEEQYKIKADNHSYTTSLGDLGGEILPPSCPSGGSYSASVDSNGNLTISCDYHSGQSDAHGSFRLGVDNE